MFTSDLLTRLFPHPSSSRRARRGRKAKGATPSRRRRPRLEALENRHLLAAVVVTTSADETDGGDTSSIAALIGNPGTDGTISLREAILASNNTPGANSIRFAPGTSGAPILLTQGELLISNAVSITGLGADNTTLDAQRLSRIFDITAAAGAVTLDGLTLTNGEVQDANGGAIYTLSDLAVLNSSIGGNQSFGVGFGGGIYSGSGAVTISNGIIFDNTALDVNDPACAGIYSVSGAVTLSNSSQPRRVITLSCSSMAERVS